MGIQLKKGQEIAGIPALTIRDLLRDIADRSFNAAWLEKKRLGWREDDMLQTLLRAEYIQPDPEKTDPSSGPFYKITEKGRSMMRATGAKRVRRNTAARVLEEFMERVREVNDNPRFLVEVTEVLVFGSYLGENDALGDVDIACSYRKKFTSIGKGAFENKLKEHFIASGRPSRGLSDLFLPWEEVRLFLKNRKRTISLHYVEEVEQMLRQTPALRFEVLLGNREDIVNRSKPHG